MRPLSQHAQALIDAASAVEEPSDAYRERMRLKLEARLGVKLSEASTAVGAATKAAAKGGAANGAFVGILAKAGVIIAVFGVLLGGGALLLGDLGRARLAVPAPEAIEAIETVKASPSTTSSAVPSEPTAPAAPAATMANEPPPPPHASPAPPRRPAVSPKVATAPSSPKPSAVSDGGVTQELTLLGGAQAALSSGKADHALALLEQHAREHPDGALREERLAARVFALCALGRRGEARAEAQRFVKEAPRSPLAARVRAACPVGDVAAPKP